MTESFRQMRSRSMTESFRQMRRRNTAGSIQKTPAVRGTKPRTVRKATGFSKRQVWLQRGVTAICSRGPKRAAK